MRKALLPGLLFLSTLTVFAQKKKVEIGFQGGINLNRAYGDGVLKSWLSNANGVSAGGYVKWNIASHFGIKVQPFYDQFGWVYRSLILESGLFTGSKTDLFYKLDYLSLPVLAEYTVGKSVKWKINAGPYSGFLVKSKVIEKSSPPLAAGQPAVMETTIHDFRKLNFGLAVGTGLQVPITSKVALNIDFRNITGLTNIGKSSAGYSSIKTFTYSFLGGLSFWL